MVWIIIIWTSFNFLFLFYYRIIFIWRPMTKFSKLKQNIKNCKLIFLSLRVYLLTTFKKIYTIEHYFYLISKIRKANYKSFFYWRRWCFLYLQTYDQIWNGHKLFLKNQTYYLFNSRDWVKKTKVVRNITSNFSLNNWIDQNTCQSFLL